MCGIQLVLTLMVVCRQLMASDADVLTIENSRSGDEMIQALAKYGYKRDIGPGMLHSTTVGTSAAATTSAAVRRLSVMIAACLQPETT